MRLAISVLALLPLLATSCTSVSAPAVVNGHSSAKGGVVQEVHYDLTVSASDNGRISSMDHYDVRAVREAVSKLTLTGSHREDREALLRKLECDFPGKVHTLTSPLGYTWVRNPVTQEWEFVCVQDFVIQVRLDRLVDVKVRVFVEFN